MDLFAAEIGMDPVEVRRRNLIPPFDEPYTTSSGADLRLRRLRSRRSTRRSPPPATTSCAPSRLARRADGDPVQLGIGVSVYVEITGGTRRSASAARVVIGDDGSATVYTGTSPHGQGHADGVGDDRRRASSASRWSGSTVVHGDTDLVPIGGGTHGLPVAAARRRGGAAHGRAESPTQAKQLAADLLEASRRRRRARRRSRPVPRGRHARRRTASGPRSPSPPASASGCRSTSTSAGPASHRRTRSAPTSRWSRSTPRPARVRLLRHDRLRRRRPDPQPAARRRPGPRRHRPGRGPGAARGGALRRGRQPDHVELRRLRASSAAELPSFELVAQETPTPVNPLGAKGIGESGTIGSTPAVQIAVVDAVAHLGVRHIDMPATPETVWRAIRAAQS